MQKREPTIRNKQGEKLDTWVETPEGEIKATVIMVHGFGTDKHETAGYFDDISDALVTNSFRVVRFDFSGYGKSEGAQEDACYTKQVDDLEAVIAYVKNIFSEPVHIFAQSMGCFVTALTSPTGITKTVMTGIPNHNTQHIVDRFIARFGTRPGAKLDMNGVSELPRSTGKVQKIGKQFWDDLLSLNHLQEISSYSNKTKLLIVHWQQDEVLGTSHLEDYDKIASLQSMWLSGDHSLKNPTDRQNFIKIMLEFYSHE